MIKMRVFGMVVSGLLGIAGVSFACSPGDQRARGAGADLQAQLREVAQSSSDTDTVMVKLRSLLEQKADVNGADRRGNTALHFAIEAHQQERFPIVGLRSSFGAAKCIRFAPYFLCHMVRELILAGADENQANKKGETVAGIIESHRNNADYRKLLEAFDGALAERAERAARVACVQEHLQEYLLAPLVSLVCEFEAGHSSGCE